MNRRQFFGTTAVGLAVAAGAGEPERKMRVAVIGHTGHGNYGHGLDTMWQGVPGTELVAVADADEKGLAAGQKRLKVEKGFADYRRMLAEIRPAIVAIAPRYVDEHRDMVLAAVEAGVKGIYMEKPFCRTPAEADAMVAACESRGVKLAVAHRAIYHPVLPVVDRLIEEGAIGQLLELRGRGKEDSRGGVLDLWVLGSHVLNLAHRLTGKPLACSAVLLENGRPAVPGDITEGAEGVGPVAGNELHARFEMECGVPVFFESIRNGGSREVSFGLQLVGTRGVIHFRFDREPFAHLLPGSPFAVTPATRTWVAISTAGVDKPEPMTNIVSEFNNHLWPAEDLMAAIREDRSPVCSGEVARVTVEMISAVLESHRQEGRRVAIPLKTRENPLA
jgi:predicted dehydrogenase